MPPTARLARCGSEPPSRPSLTCGSSLLAAECSIPTSLPDGASPPGRDPGAQTVAGRETKSKQDSYVRQHRMFPEATSRPLAIVVPSQPVSTPILRTAAKRRRAGCRAYWSYPIGSERRCLRPAAAFFRALLLTSVPCCCQSFSAKD